MVIFVDGPAYRAKGIVAVGKDIGDGKLLKPACARRLDDPNKCDVMGSDLIKLYLKLLVVSRGIVCLQDRPRNGAFLCFFPDRRFSEKDAVLLIFCFRDQLGTIYQIHATII